MIRALAQESPATNSKRPSAYIDGAYPTHLVRGLGLNVWDADGNKYIDFVCGLGANLLGHNHPKVTEEVHKAIAAGGPSFSLPHPLETEVAEILQGMIPMCERVRFMKNGTDSTQAAVRIARTYTNEAHVVSHGYHGAGDIWTSLTDPALGVMDEFKIQSDQADPEGKIYICEPIQLKPNEDREMNEARMKKARLTIFDEIITGGRVPEWTCSKWWKADNDMICLGKGLANGYPLSVVGGKKEIMNCGEYFLSSTFGGEIISLAACKATLEELRKKSAHDLWFYANRFMDKVNEIVKPLEFKIEGYGTRGMFPVEHPKAQEFMQEAMDQGILIGKAWFYGYQHLEEMHEDMVLNILNEVAKRVASGRVTLRGKAPIQTFKR